MVAGLLAPACGKNIGDPCTTNVDCAQDGTRDCDLSQPGGYCTVDGCDEYSCPSESVCIRVFPFPSTGVACTQDTDCATGRFCLAEGFCSTTAKCAQDSDCGSDSLCLPEGLCVSRISERRYCEYSCGGNGDCRSGYVCRQAGVEGLPASTSGYGSIALVANATQSTVVKFCSPSP